VLLCWSLTDSAWRPANRPPAGLYRCRLVTELVLSLLVRDALRDAARSLPIRQHAHAARPRRLRDELDDEVLCLASAEPANTAARKGTPSTQAYAAGRPAERAAANATASARKLTADSSTQASLPCEVHSALALARKLRK
jgi:hypothetical protein